MHRSARAFVVMLGVSFLAANSGLSSSLPDDIAQVVVLATHAIDLDQQVEVLSGDLIVNDVAGELELDREVATATGFRLAADGVEIDRGSVVGGDVAYNNLENKGTIQGSLLTPLALPVFDQLPPFEEAVPGGENITVGNGDSLSLPAGAYGKLSVKKGGTVRFEGGDYSFERIDAAKETSLLFSNAARVRVAGRVKVDKESVVGPEAGAAIAANDIVFYVSAAGGGDDEDDGNERGDDDDGDDDDGDDDDGDDDDGDDDDGDDDDGDGEGGSAFTLGQKSVLSANVFAPNGTIRIGRKSIATGAFFALEVEIDREVKLALDSFFNECPVAADDSATVAEGAVATVLDSGASSVLANDTDPNPGDTLTVTATPVSGPDHGLLTLNFDGTFSYTHDGSDTLADAFVYEACDDGFPIECDTATVSITVLAVNDPPTAMDDSASTDEDVAISIDVLANDSDPDGSLDPSTVTVTSGPSNGSATVNTSTGAVTYTPAENRSGIDSFTYEVCDDGIPEPVQCALATVTVDVAAVNDAPEAHDDQASTSVNVAANVFALANDLDTDGVLDSSSLAVVGAVANATVSLAGGGTFTVAPSTGFVGTIVFDYQVCDDGVPPPVLCDTATVTVEVTEVGENRSPVANDRDVQVAPGGSATITISGSDPDGDELMFTIVGSPTQGTATRPSPLTLTSAQVSYSANAGATGSDSFDFQVDDGNGGTDVGTVTISFGGGNRAPESQPDRAVVAAGDSVSVLITGASRLTENDVDPDGDALVMATTPVSGPSSGSLALSPDGSFVYTHGGGSEAEDSFVYEVCDTGVPIRCTSETATIEIRPLGFTASILKSGDGAGIVSSSPDGISCGSVCSASFPGASRVRLFAEASPGSEFIGWSGDADCDDAALAMFADRQCTATFSLLPPPDETRALTIVKQGDGMGTVSSNPRGILCGGTCSAEFLLGTTVALLVRPDGGSVFTGWSGDADCSDGEVTLTADVTCIAIFAAQ